MESNGWIERHMSMADIKKALTWMYFRVTKNVKGVGVCLWGPWDRRWCLQPWQGFHLRTIHVLVEEVSQVLIHSGSMSLIWSWVEQKVGRAQSRSGTKNGTKNVGFCHTFFDCPANREGLSLTYWSWQKWGLGQLPSFLHKMVTRSSRWVTLRLL